MNNFLANVEKIFETLKQFETNINLKNQIYKLSRASRSKICKENEQTFPNKGYCAS